MAKPKITHSIMFYKENGKFCGKKVPVIEEPEDETPSPETIDFWNAVLDVSIAGCIGCGYCCAKGPCDVTCRHEVWHLETGCEALVWDGTRHWCKFVLDDPKLYTEHLAIGCGCSSSLFNGYREKLRNLVGTRLT
jgi:hypothetical protein